MSSIIGSGTDQASQAGWTDQYFGKNKLIKVNVLCYYQSITKSVL